jgi:hypothetical protein
MPTAAPNTYIHQLAADVNEALQLTAEGKSAMGMYIIL